jgi:hypothetical protein
VVGEVHAEPLLCATDIVNELSDWFPDPLFVIVTVTLSSPEVVPGYIGPPDVLLATLHCVAEPTDAVPVPVPVD